MRALSLLHLNRVVDLILLLNSISCKLCFLFPLSCFPIFSEEEKQIYENMQCGNRNMCIALT